VAALIYEVILPVVFGLDLSVLGATINIIMIVLFAFGIFHFRKKLHKERQINKD